MATVTVFTAQKMQEIVDETIIGASINGSDHLILAKRDLTTIDAGLLPGAGNASYAYVDNAVATAVSNLLDGAPGALDTLNELAAALNDDAAFSATVANTIAGLSSTYVAKAAVPIEFCVVVGDEITALTTEVSKVSFRAPYAFTLTNLKANLNTASSSGIPTIDVNEAGVTLLSTKLTIDVGELTSATAASPVVTSDTTIADDAVMSIDIDVAGTGAAGLKIWFYGTRVLA